MLPVENRPLVPETLLEGPLLKYKFFKKRTQPRDWRSAVLTSKLVTLRTRRTLYKWFPWQGSSKAQGQLKTHLPWGKKKNSVPWPGDESPMRGSATPKWGRRVQTKPELKVQLCRVFNRPGVNRTTCTLADRHALKGWAGEGHCSRRSRLASRGWNEKS